MKDLVEVAIRQISGSGLLSEEKKNKKAKRIFEMINCDEWNEFFHVMEKAEKANIHPDHLVELKREQYLNWKRNK